jgi:RNA polymerase sigma-70 factor (ECF subfamily)
MKRTRTFGEHETQVADESALIARAAAGERAAHDALVRAHYARVHRTAFHLLGNHEDAEDVAQECFVKAFQGLAWFRGDASFAAWLRRILVHLVRDRYRRAGRRPGAEPLQGDESLGAAAAAPGGPEHEVGRRELQRLLDEALRRLPESLRVALVLRTRDDLSYAEISEAAGVTPATARTQVMRARRALLAHLGPYLGPSLGAHTRGDRRES